MIFPPTRALLAAVALDVVSGGKFHVYHEPPQTGATPARGRLSYRLANLPTQRTLGASALRSVRSFARTILSTSVASNPRKYIRSRCEMICSVLDGFRHAFNIFKHVLGTVAVFWGRLSAVFGIAWGFQEYVSRGLGGLGMARGEFWMVLGVSDNMFGFLGDLDSFGVSSRVSVLFWNGLFDVLMVWRAFPIF